MAAVVIPNVTNWSVTPQNGQKNYFVLMNTWLSESTSVISSLNTAIVKINESNTQSNSNLVEVINARDITVQARDEAVSAIATLTAGAIDDTTIAINKAFSNSYIQTNYINKATNQTIAGVKTFSSSPIVPTPVSTDNSNQIATTAFVQKNFNVTSSVNNVDFNTITDAGLYERVIQGTSPNGMGGNDYYYIVVYRLDSTTLVQVAYPYSTIIQNKKVWTRTRYASTWGDWNLVSGGAVSQAITLSNPTKNVGATWQKLIFSAEQISTASNVCKYLTGSGNFQVLSKGTYELTAQIYPSPAQNTNAKISLYLGLFDLGTNGAGDTLISVANEEFPSGQHPSVSLSRVVEVTTDNRYFAFKWYFLDGGGVTPDMTLQTSSIYTYANIKKI